MLISDILGLMQTGEDSVSVLVDFFLGFDRKFLIILLIQIYKCLMNMIRLKIIYSEIGPTRPFFGTLAKSINSLHRSLDKLRT